MLSMDGRITRFRFSWIRDRTGSALKHREGEVKSLSCGRPTPPLVQTATPQGMNRSDLARGGGLGGLGLRWKLRHLVDHAGMSMLCKAVPLAPRGSYGAVAWAQEAQSKNSERGGLSPRKPQASLLC